MDNKTKQNFKNNSIMLIIILATVFGIASGIVGGLITRTYLLDSSYNIPFFGEIDFSDGSYKGSSFIIRDARKVIVEQDAKVIETVDSVSNSVVGIFKKYPLQREGSRARKIKEGDIDFNLNNFYKIEQEIGQGFIITSDGWIITSSLPAQASKADILGNYIVITKDKRVYNIDNIASDSLTPFYFLHVEAKDFPVRKFASQNEIKNGQLVITVNWDGESWLTLISDKQDKAQSLINFSDSFFSEIDLVDDPPEKFKDSALFNLAGDVVGLIDNQGKVRAISQLQGAIKSLLKHKEIKRANFGVNYIDLARLVRNPLLVPERLDKYDKGAVIYKSSQGIAVVKGGAADLAGLAEGDIIVSVNNIEINKDNNLTDVIQQFIAGDTVNIVFLRNNKIEEVEVKL